MKQCKYCWREYDVSLKACPSCNSTEHILKCDNCGRTQDSNQAAFCLNCGFDYYEKPVVCPKCGVETRGRICWKCGNDIANTASIGAVVAAVASKVSCAVVGHDFVGCKCARCGETRDEGHELRPVQYKCEQVCRVCGKTEAMKHTWVDGRCSRCGKSRFVLAGYFRNTRKVNASVLVVTIALIAIVGVLVVLVLLKT